MILRLASFCLAALLALPSLATAEDVAVAEPPPGDAAVRKPAPVDGDVTVTTGAVAHAMRRTASVSIDGKLDDPGWKDAPVNGGFVQRFPKEGQAPTHKTEFRVVYDDAAIYISIRAYDSEPREVRGLLTRRDVQS